ncbi:MAG: hypothetical protein AB2A00_13070 [Myxococcota bacterium]
MRFFLITTLAAALLTGCTGEGEGTTSSSSSSSGGGGSGCTEHSDCPGGYVCKLRICQTSCDPTKGAIVNGCVVGARCENNQCVKNTSCDENTMCAYDKGEVCQYSTGTCIDATSTCDENNQPECANGYKCNVSVCHVDCQGSAGCASGKTCNGGTCQ